MAEIKFLQKEIHQVIIKQTMSASTTDWEGNEVISKEDLETYILEGTTGDDGKDDICWQQVADADCIDQEEPYWWSDHKGFTEVEYTLIDKENSEE